MKRVKRSSLRKVWGSATCFELGILLVVFYCALRAFHMAETQCFCLSQGMVLVDPSLHPKASWEFDADIAILTHSTTIAPK